MCIRDRAGDRFVGLQIPGLQHRTTHRTGAQHAQQGGIDPADGQFAAFAHRLAEHALQLPVGQPAGPGLSLIHI